MDRSNSSRYLLTSKSLIQPVRALVARPTQGHPRMLLDRARAMSQNQLLFSRPSGRAHLRAQFPAEPCVGPLRSGVLVTATSSRSRWLDRPRTAVCPRRAVTAVGLVARALARVPGGETSCIRRRAPVLEPAFSLMEAQLTIDPRRAAAASPRCGLGSARRRGGA